MRPGSASALRINGTRYSLRGATPDLGDAANRLGTVYARGLNAAISSSSSIGLDIRAASGQSGDLIRCMPSSGSSPRFRVLPRGEVVAGDFGSSAKYLLLAGSSGVRSELLFAKGPGGTSPYHNGMGIRFEPSDNQLHIDGNSTANSSRLSVHRDTGHVGIGHTTTTQRLDVAGNLALRNGVTPTELLIHSTYTDADNYERLRIYKSGSSFYIAPEAAGTGVVRDLSLPDVRTNDISARSSTLRVRSADGTNQVSVSNSGLSLANQLSVPSIKSSSFFYIYTAASAEAFRLGNSLLTITPPSGVLSIPGLPTTDPAAVDRIWNDGGTLRISAG